MTREFLKSLGIEDKDVTDKIMAENGRDINAEKAKFGDYETLKTQLADANKQIEEFGKLDYEGVKKAADDYKEKFEQAQAESKRQLEEMQFNHVLDGELTTAKAKSVKAVRALLNTEKLKLNKDGTLTGLTEQLEAVKKEHAYLFAEDEPKEKPPVFLGGSAGTDPQAGEDDAIRAIMGLPPITK